MQILICCAYRMVEGISADLPNNDTTDNPNGGDENKLE